MSVLKSAERITTDTAVAIFGRHRVEGTRGWIRHDVDVYRVTYETQDADGAPIVASGAVLIPRCPRLVGMSSRTGGTEPICFVLPVIRTIPL